MKLIFQIVPEKTALMSEKIIDLKPALNENIIQLIKFFFLIVLNFENFVDNPGLAILQYKRS